MSFNKSTAVAGLVILLGAATFAGGVVAQDQEHSAESVMMQGMSHGGSAGGDHAQTEGGHGARGAEATGSPATEAYRAANTAMHEAMNIEFSDNADIDFARGMIGHHEGAIDMARIVLEHGEDPDLRQLAEDVIATQEEEITFLRQWIAKNAE